jgi:hypothetical protein
LLSGASKHYSTEGERIPKGVDVRTAVRGICEAVGAGARRVPDALRREPQNAACDIAKVNPFTMPMIRVVSQR